MSKINININLPKIDAWINQHGNAKNADIKRLSKLFDSTFNTVMKNKTVSTLLIVAVLADVGTRNGIKIYKAIKEEHRKDKKETNIIEVINIEEGKNE